MASWLEPGGFGGGLLGPTLLGLGAGIASGGGWGQGIGRGLALAQGNMQNQRESQLQQLLLNMKMAEMGKPSLETMQGPLGPQSVWAYPDQRLEPAHAPGAGGGGASVPMDKVIDLSSKFTQLPQYKTYTESSPLYGTVLDAEKRNTKAADLNMVMAVAKLFDPGSVVRGPEGEMIRQTAALPDVIWNTYRSLMQGTAALDPTTRRNLVTEARSRMTQYREALAKERQRFGRIADTYGIPLDQVIDEVPEIAELMPLGTEPNQSNFPKKSDIGAPLDPGLQGGRVMSMGPLPYEKDPARRQIGQVYTMPDGRQALWTTDPATGQMGWEVVYAPAQ